MLIDSLCILETTGGYEMALLLSLCNKSIAVHRTNTLKIKNFIRSFGNSAKTDSLDTRAFALYGYERSEQLELFRLQSKQALDLYKFVSRRNDLKQILVAEKNRLAGPRADIIKASCKKMIDSTTKEIDALIEEDPMLKAKKAMLQTIEGIGRVVSNELIALLP